jgi:nucleotide-binding universal stress UspA family protein
VLKATSARSGPGRFRRILAAVNAATLNPVEKALNTKILELATSLAEREAAEVHVVHCWTIQGDMILTARGRLPKSELSEYRRRTRRRNLESLDALLRPFLESGHEIEKHMHKGDPGTLIPRIAEELRADLVVMGTVARTGIEGVFIGNTAEHVLQRIGRSVLAVKPDGFVSPVRPAH